MARLELKGAPVSPGIGIGSALVIVEAGTMDIPKRSLEGKEVEPALDRFESARNRAIQGLQSIQEVTAKELGIQDAAIYGAQVAVLQDPDALKQVRNLIAKERLEPESAIRDLLEGLAKATLFGGLTAIVGVVNGARVQGGAEGVGGYASL